MREKNAKAIYAKEKTDANKAAKAQAEAKPFQDGMEEAAKAERGALRLKAEAEAAPR